MDFILSVVQSFWFQAILKLVLGFLLAGLIGLERSSWSKPAGFRTHSLVGISAVLIMLCGEYMSREYNIDPSRIPAQLLSGIGFIGAGTILRDGFNVKGLTTAAGLLAVTCIGLSIGAGFYLGGILTAVIVYIIMSYSYKFSEKLDHFNILELEIKISKNDLKKLFTFQEYAASDPNKMIEMTVFLSTKQIDVELIPNEEILHYHWYKVGENYNISSSIKDHFLPYAQKNNIIY